MKANRIGRLSLISLAMGMARSAEAAKIFGGTAGTGVPESFTVQHPVAIVVINLVVITLLLGFGVIAFATLFKSPGEL